ncbi:MAG TPA: cytochrome c [Thermoanaerobaculia bacterium]|nr:cytochrome c [Thermoanaerobaculia bacterium]
MAIVSLFSLALASPLAAADGAALFKSKCAGCHGADGAGQTTMGKTLKIRDLRVDEVQKQTDVELTKVISGGKGKMPAYGKQLSTDDVKALIAHIRTLHAK